MEESNSNSLKESLDILETVDIDLSEFAIDSDDDDDHNDDGGIAQEMNTSTAAVISQPQSHSQSIPNNNNTSNSMSVSTSMPTSMSTSTSTAGVGSTKLKKQTVTANDDPLSSLLNSSALTSTTTPGVNHTASTGNYPTSTSPSLPHNNTTTTTTTTAATAPPGAYNVSNANTNVNAVTQSLSSTFSSWSSKFQDAVTSVASTTSTTPPSSSLSSSVVSGIHRNVNVNVNVNVNNGVGIGNNGATIHKSNSEVSSASYNSSAGPTTTFQSNPNPNPNPVPTVYNSALHRNNNLDPNHPQVQQQQKQQQQQQQQKSHVYQTGVVGNNGMNEFDHVMKTSLINSAIGELLPGERVVVFLSNLVQVRDTSSPQTGIGLSTFHHSEAMNDLVWCCAVTFYRLVLFSYYPSDFAGAGSGAGVTNNNDDTISNITNESKTWIETASVSRQYQQIQVSRIRQNGKRHDVLQMPLASIDRVEKSTDFGMGSKNKNSSTQMGFSTAAVNYISGNMNSTASSVVGSDYMNDAGIGGAVAGGTLVVYGKDNGRFIQFTTPSYAECMRAYESLNTYAFPGRRNLGYLFAFESRRAEVMASTNPDEVDKQQHPNNGTMRIGARATPRRYDAMVEFSRMVSGPTGGLNRDSNSHLNCPWVPILQANATYNLCSSYPSVLFAPNTVDESKPEGMRLLRDTASFRSGARFQTLSWASRFDGASLWRSAQPKVGLQGNRSAADELFMKKVAESAALANSYAAVSGLSPPRPSLAFLKMLTGCINESDLMLENFRSKDAAAFNEKCMMKIFDMRPKSSAMANKTAGYGYENTSNYKGTTLSFFGIGNIHAVRDSYKKISALCASPATNDVQWMQLVEETKWLSFIRLILSASWQAAFHIRYNRLPVLVHCSHGWDRTSQVSALTQIFLDPYFRTRAGFSCLVEKDFLALGHPLHTRCGHGEGKGGDTSGAGSSSGQSDEISPIFLQFLDCVFQIVNQYPDYFEFNTKYLLLISEHIYSCRFGTLLCDTEREREVVASIRQRTYCLWEHLEACPDLVNTNFSHSDSLSDSEVIEGKGCLLMPLPSLLRNVTLWADRHCMYGAKPTFRSIPLSDSVGIDSEKSETPLLSSQPLHGLNEFRDNSLKLALDEASRLKEVVKQREQEILHLKTQLEEAQIKSSVQ